MPKRESVSNPTREHMNTVARLLRFTKSESEEFNLRDCTVLYRMKGRILAVSLPGIGADFKRLDAPTDDYNP